jgi:hypothetical protein
MQKSESIVELSKALVKAQIEMVNPKKNTTNGFYKSSYADLSEVISVSKLPLANNGLSVIQMPSQQENWVNVETMLVHESGEYITSMLSMPLPEKSHNMSQEVGKCITYARRYALASICGISQEDEDAQGSTQSKPKVLPNKKPVNKKAKAEEQELIQRYVHQIDVNCASGEAGEVQTLLEEVNKEGIKGGVWKAVSPISKSFIESMNEELVA